ncbi:YceD family protein [Roseivirga thermotolerans]|uniref:DNA-binding protein n=1 Tax=Roseivirga thermotolerans TaxID=1758176 RepID=A0ABQ3I482_9BACT|nr:DUF177 domain-containing protein [Roseivirga thermotolerans]GHE60298.1 DNA-binding protein [Roseivirga thermotolerans]
MKAAKRFDIHIYKLSNGIHDYTFEIGNEFFDMFDGDLLSEGKLAAAVTLNKSDSMIQVNYKIDGTVVLSCDRSLDLFDFPVNTEHNIIYKYGDEEKELSEDVFVIDKNTQVLNVANILFEFIGLQIPMKKLHPRYEDEEMDTEEGQMVYSSALEKDIEQEEDTTDPRWAALKNLKK